ncbi:MULTISPECIES: hypothetical protein [Aeromonas]|uniref:hypothetical protein n=1 Tax=Aeromonas TaxID=642 RepID=UPI000DD0AED3|nr:hypothetical protein [Aeromonas media]MDW4560169.1 hypothetical protein [Aeromonas rivipollensis]
MISESFEDLAQSLRIFLESYWKLGQLLEVDRAEAVGNMEGAFKSILNSYHSLYDSMLKEPAITVDWYATPQLAIILAIRNAKHHNVANKIRNIFNYHIFNHKSPSDSSAYLLVDFPAPPEEEGGDCFDFYISWNDIDVLLQLPRKESRLRDGTRDLIRDYLHAQEFEKIAKKEGIEKERVFINSVPIVLNAGIALSPHIKDIVKTVSTEGKHFNWHFENVCPAVTDQHEIQKVMVSLPN